MLASARSAAALDLFQSYVSDLLGTALRFQDTITLDRYEYNDNIMHNPYSFIFVSEGEANGATTLLDYILGDGRATIESFTINGDAAFFVY